MPTIAILVAVVVLVAILAQLWTEVLWFDSVGFTTVCRVEVLTKVAAVRRRRPAWPPGSSPPAWSSATGPGRSTRRSREEQQNLDHYREMLDPLRRVATVVAPALLGLFAGSAAASQWQIFSLWHNRVPFGTKDAQFSLDIGFFVFTLPWLRFIVGFLTMVHRARPDRRGASPTTCTAALQLQSRGERTTTAARVHLSLLLAALVAGPRRQLLAGPLLPDHRGLPADHRPDLHRRSTR